jgi:prepilin-type N-terminal cleavage/methylation domain-containing protein
MTMRAHGEQGMTLIEVLVAMIIMAIVIVSVDTSVGVLNARSNSMSQSSQAIDQLQMAEQTVVRYVHAATAFSTAPGAGQLQFTANIDKATAVTIAIKLSTMGDGSEQLTVSKSGNTMLTVSNLDPSSNFTPTTITYPLVGGVTYYVSIAVILTMDSPRYGAPNATKTTVADADVQVWNIRYACQVAWQQDTGGQGATPC